MWQTLKNKILQIGHASGIEIILLPDGEMVISAVTIKLKRHKIVKEAELSFIRNFDELSHKLDRRHPLTVVINGKGILHKKITAGLPEDKIFGNILPNARPDEFYQSSVTYGSFISAWVVRKEVVDKIIHELTGKGFKVLTAMIGVNAIDRLLPYLNLGDQHQLQSNNYLIHIERDNKLGGVETIPLQKDGGIDRSEYSIGDQYVFSTGLLSFGAALGLLAGEGYVSQNISNEDIKKQGEEFRFFKYYKVSLWTLLAGVFAILLINFILYDHYFQKNESRLAFRLINQSSEIKIQKIRASIRTKEDFIRKYDWAHASRLSFYADRIAGLLPDDAILTDMKISPVNTGLDGEDGRITFRRDTIEITGTCDDPTTLNRFVNNLKNIPDFKAVGIKSYLYRKEAQNGIFLMEIITI
jgi:Tfp pilus assembly protein PilN